MKKLIFMGALLLGTSVYAAEAEDFFGFIFDIIGNEINKDKPGNSNANKKVILKETENKIVLGRVFLTPNKEVDSVSFPACKVNGAGNKKVQRLRLVVNNNDVYIASMKVTYGNGQSQNFQINGGFNDGDTSGWINLSGKADRCVRQVRITGDVQAKSGFSINFGSGGISTSNSFNNRAVVNIVGLKQ